MRRLLGFVLVLAILLGCTAAAQTTDSGKIMRAAQLVYSNLKAENYKAVFSAFEQSVRESYSVEDMELIQSEVVAKLGSCRDRGLPSMTVEDENFVVSFPEICDEGELEIQVFLNAQAQLMRLYVLYEHNDGERGGVYFYGEVEQWKALQERAAGFNDAMLQGDPQALKDALKGQIVEVTAEDLLEYWQAAADSLGNYVGRISCSVYPWDEHHVIVDEEFEQGALHAEYQFDEAGNLIWVSYMRFDS